MANVTNASSPLPPTENPPAIRATALWEVYSKTYFATGVLVAVLAVVTVVGNGMLLLAIWKDPFKSFRTPTTSLIVGLALADFVTGGIVDPCMSCLSFLSYLKLVRKNFEMYQTLIHVSSHVASTTMNASFFLLLALTWNQFAAIKFPYKHKHILTKNRLLFAVVVIWAYSILQSLWGELGVPDVTSRRIDIHLNTNTVLFLLLVAYGCLFHAFMKHLRKVESLAENNANQDRRRHQERRFTSVNLLLVTFFLVSSLPSIVLWHLELYRFPNRRGFDSDQQRARFAIAQVLAQALLQVKFALDPFAYAWRLPRYRKAFRVLFTCGKRRGLQHGAGGTPMQSREEQPPAAVGRS